MEFDYVIVGAGSAGCVLANRLSADRGNRVCLLEAGGEDRNPWIHIPAGFIKTMIDPSVNWLFETKPDERTGNRPIPIPRGKVMGGSSAINGMVYVRGQARDYDTWAQMGCTGWSYSDVLPYFKRSESRESGGDEFHGDDGPLNVAEPRTTYDSLDKVIDAGGELGYPMHNDYNGKSQAGFSYFQLTQRNGKRYSAKNAYVDPVRERRDNLQIEPRAFAEKVIFDGRRATGVQYRQGSEVRTVTARKEVILCAGAVQSPQILELSGVGQGERLRSLGVDVVHDLPGVGENLQDHYISRLTWRMKDVESLNQMTKGPRLVMEVLRYGLTRRGALSMPAGIVCGFIKSRPELDEPDIQYHIANATFKDSKKRIFDPFPGLTIGPCQLRPESRGTIHAESPDPSQAPAIRPNFFSAREDGEVHVAGMRFARQMVETAALRPYMVNEISPGVNVDSDEELLDYALNNGATLYHPVGTCKMGTDPQAVTDAELRVHGIQNLRVVDASVMPRLVSGNTNAPVMMIAEKAADMIMRDVT